MGVEQIKSSWGQVEIQGIGKVSDCKSVFTIVKRFTTHNASQSDLRRIVEKLRGIQAGRSQSSNFDGFQPTQGRRVTKGKASSQISYSRRSSSNSHIYAGGNMCFEQGKGTQRETLGDIIC